MQHVQKNEFLLKKFALMSACFFDVILMQAVRALPFFLTP